MSQSRRVSSRTKHPAQHGTGSIGAYFGCGLQTHGRPSKMASGRGKVTEAQGKDAARHSLQTPNLVRAATPSDSPGSVASLGLTPDAADVLGDRDLRQHLLSLPTREDLDRFVTRVEKAFKQDIDQLKADTTQLGNRLESLEQIVDEALPTIAKLGDKCAAQDYQIEALLTQLDDYENRSRRSNIRIRGLPEATGASDIVPTLQGIFKELLGLSPNDKVEIDRAHRALRPQSQDAENPRDIICKLHRYTVKDRIMQLMRKRPYFDFDGARLFFYQGLSRRTLMQRRALSPLLESLRSADIKYSWGFPFRLQASRDGRSAILRNKDDLPRFLSQLQLEPVDFTDWRMTSAIPTVAAPQPWQQVRSSRGRKRPSSTGAGRGSPTGD